MQTNNQMRWHTIGYESWLVWALAVTLVPASIILVVYVLIAPAAVPILERVFYAAMLVAAIVIAASMAIVQYRDERSKKLEPEWYEIPDREEFLQRLRERSRKAA